MHVLQNDGHPFVNSAAIGFAVVVMIKNVSTRLAELRTVQYDTINKVIGGNAHLSQTEKFVR